MHVVLLKYVVGVQLIPSGFNHQVILASVPAMPDTWYVVDAAFGSRSPLEPLALREPEHAHASGGQKSFLIMTEQIHIQQNLDVPHSDSISSLQAVLSCIENRILTLTICLPCRT